MARCAHHRRDTGTRPHEKQSRFGSVPLRRCLVWCFGRAPEGWFQEMRTSSLKRRHGWRPRLSGRRVPTAREKDDNRFPRDCATSTTSSAGSRTTSTTSASSVSCPTESSLHQATAPNRRRTTTTLQKRPESPLQPYLLTPAPSRTKRAGGSTLALPLARCRPAYPEGPSRARPGTLRSPLPACPC